MECHIKKKKTATRDSNLGPFGQQSNAFTTWPQCHSQDCLKYSNPSLLSRAGATISHEDGPQVHVHSVLSLPGAGMQQHLNQVSA